MIGNRAIIETLGNLTAGVYNYMRAANSTAYKLKDIIKQAHDYLYPSQDNIENPSESLLAYMTQAKGFSIDRFKGQK